MAQALLPDGIVRSLWPFLLILLPRGFYVFVKHVAMNKRALNDASLFPCLIFVAKFSRGFAQVRPWRNASASLQPRRPL